MKNNMKKANSAFMFVAPFGDAKSVFISLFVVVVILCSNTLGAVEIGCAGPNRNPAACSLEECLARGVAMHAICDQPSSCKGVFGCAELQRRRALNQQCIDLRNHVQGCYFLPDPNHDIQIAGLNNAIARCDHKISLPEPEGCADPCP